MQTYIGTKIVNAKPMTRADYNILRGWELPSDEDGSDEGFLVEYRDGGQPNHPEFSGYISWSPADVFEQAYTSIETMTFGDALVFLKEGCHITRTGWNGKGMYLILLQNTSSMLEQREGEEDLPLAMQDSIFLRTVQETLVPWTASQSDVLAEDWHLY